MIKVKKYKFVKIFFFNKNKNDIINKLGIDYNFQKCYCTDNYFVNFAIANNNEDSINFEIFAGEYLLKKEICEYKNSKEISLLVNSEVKLSEFFLNWNFTSSKLKGKIDLSQILKEFQFKFRNDVVLIFYILISFTYFLIICIFFN